MPLLRLGARRRDGRRPPLVILLPLLIGVTFLTGAAILAQPTIVFMKKAGSAEARYVGAIADHPRFRFTTADGTIVTFTARSGRGADGWQAGDRAAVGYDPLQPADARLLTLRDAWAGPLTLATIGLVAIVGGALLLRAWRRRSDRGEVPADR